MVGIEGTCNQVTETGGGMEIDIKESLREIRRNGQGTKRGEMIVTGKRIQVIGTIGEEMKDDGMSQTAGMTEIGGMSGEMAGIGTIEETTEEERIEETTEEEKIEGRTEEKRIEGMTEEERIEGMTEEERIEGRTEEKRIEGMTEEERIEGRTEEKRIEGRTEEKRIEGMTEEERIEGRTEEKRIDMIDVLNTEMPEIAEMGGTEMGALIVSVEKATVVVTEIDTKTEIGAMWKIEMTDVELDTGWPSELEEFLRVGIPLVTKGTATR